MPIPTSISTEEVLKDDVSFLKVGKQVYALTPVECDINQTIEHVQTHYKTRVDNALRDLNMQAYGLADVEANAEFNAITESLRRNTVAIPQNQREELVVAINNALAPVRVVQQFVTAMRGRTYNYSAEALRNIAAKHPNFNADMQRNNGQEVDLVVSFQTTPVATVCYALCAGKIAVNRQTYHTFRERVGDRDKWFKLCTGSVPAEQFWAQASFYDSVRIINIDSPSYRSMRFDVPNRNFSFEELLQTFNYTYAFTSRNQPGWVTGGGQ
jgi:hypothetical protein